MAYDVIVLGLGGMGSAAAASLAAAGLRVLGLERRALAHDYGSSHGGSRIIRKAYFEGEAYVPLLLRAYDLWDRIEAVRGTRLRWRTGGLWLGAPGAPIVEGSRRSAEAHGLAHEVLDAEEIRRRFPPFAVPDGMVGLYEADAGLVHPEKSVRVHCAEAESHGATLRFQERVTGWSFKGEGVAVSTDRGSATAGALVVTAGAWLGRVLGDLGVPLVVERMVQHWFRPRERKPFLDDRFPVWILDGGHPTARPYGFPIHEGAQDRVKVALFRTSDPPVDPDRVDRAVHEPEWERIEAAVGPLLPDVPHERAGARTCLYTTTPDEHFVVGRHPDHAQVVVAGGFSGHGFKFAPVIGEICADLVLQGSTPHDIALFDPARFRP